MFTKKILVSALLAAGMIGGVALPLTSLAQVEIITLDYGPPQPRVEVVPAPRSGYVWTDGYYRADGAGGYMWNEGSWQAARPGYVYASPRWVEANGRWSYQASRWDRDGDGVSNRNDNYPNNPNYR